MLACAACAREKQHLLGQLLKEIKINPSENAMPNTGCDVSGHPFPLPQTDNIPKQSEDMNVSGEQVEGMEPGML